MDNKIVETNKQIRLALGELTRSYKEAYDQLRACIEPPCETCQYDGEFRCNACQEANYAGYNIADYPSAVRTGD